jgi:hypothetical protein
MLWVDPLHAGEFRTSEMTGHLGGQLLLPMWLAANAALPLRQIVFTAPGLTTILAFINNSERGQPLP